jgi:Endosomal/lysosomal potassium channel TMEM175
MTDLPAGARQAPRTGPSGSGAPGGLIAESSRVEAFSDGVFAVAIKLLVLDLRAPVHHGMMLHDLLAQWPAYVAYLASFTYVGVSRGAGGGVPDVVPHRRLRHRARRHWSSSRMRPRAKPDPFFMRLRPKARPASAWPWRNYATAGP